MNMHFYDMPLLPFEVISYKFLDFIYPHCVLCLLVPTSVYKYLKNVYRGLRIIVYIMHVFCRSKRNAIPFYISLCDLLFTRAKGMMLQKYSVQQSNTHKTALNYIVRRNCTQPESC